MAVELIDGSFRRAFTTERLRAALSRLQSAQVIGIDIPIGFPSAGIRPADLAAREVVGPRRHSVFLVPPRRVIRADNYTEARELAKSVWGRGLPAQTYALRDKILEADELQAEGGLIEVHPEVSFRVLAGEPLRYPKRTWNGLQQRLALLEEVGIYLPHLLDEAGRVPADDLLDAAVVAWSADRHARSRSAHLPADADIRRQPVIWY